MGDKHKNNKEKLPTKYDPQEVEQRIYGYWLDGGHFKAEANDERRPFSIAMPPPNVTADLHVGHALNNTLQDVLIRHARMLGYEALWQPGTDHAGIATQHMVEVKLLEEEDKTRHDMSRAEFNREVWKWKEKYEQRIVSTLQELGASPDWDRMRFTLDEGLSRAVREVFVRLHEKGFIYRGNYLINWCPGCQTALSDIEVEHHEQQGKLHYIEYPISGVDKQEKVMVATTRPETMLGDTALAVHPDDERYEHLVGATAVVPLAGRQIPIISDPHVDPEFGTGVVKVTPAHDPDDFEMGLRADLEQIKVIGADGKMTEQVPQKYVGLEVKECRDRLIEDLEDEGYLSEIEDHQHAVGYCYRCDTGIQPLTSRQWFVRMEELAQPAIDAVEDGKVRFIPERFGRIYLNWMENIRDWCISRQLWWGHQIPAWYCQDCDEIIVAREEPSECSKCSSENLQQDPDVLDTWFSSALWPFSTQGWPEETPELEYFYPTDVLVTGWDIIPFWVARMIFSGIEFTGEVPFSDVLIHGLVLDSEGRKMSKSLGNGVHPLEVVKEYGADALRFCLLFGNTPGNDMRFFWERAETGRNFANKLWNACRFALMHLPEDFEPASLDDVDLRLEDRWILTQMNETVQTVDEYLEQYQLGEALQEIYDFSWSQLCDWYIEMVKSRLTDGGDAAAESVLLSGLKAVLKLLHPFMPFVTEELWGALPGADGALISAGWPQAENMLCDMGAREQVELWMTVIRCIRNLRSEVNIPPSEQVDVWVLGSDEARNSLNEGTRHLSDLAGVKNLHLKEQDISSPEKALVEVAGEVRVVLPLEGVVDLEREKERLDNKLQDSIRMLERSRNKLRNEDFVNKAPEEVVQKERDRLKEAESEVEHLRNRIQQISG